MGHDGHEDVHGHAEMHFGDTVILQAQSENLLNESEEGDFYFESA